MKKLIALLTILALVLAAGCAGGTGDTTDKTTPSEGASDVTGAENVTAVQKPQTGFLLFGAQYPERAAYPQDDDGAEGAFDDWLADNESYRMYDPSRADGLNGFATAMTRALLANAEGENKVCSPLNIYMALAMLAEVTDGDTR